MDEHEREQDPTDPAATPDGELGDDVDSPLPEDTAGQDGAEEAPPTEGDADDEDAKDDEDVDQDPLDEALEETFPASDPPGNY